MIIITIICDGCMTLLFANLFNMAKEAFNAKFHWHQIMGGLVEKKVSLGKHIPYDSPQ